MKQKSFIRECWRILFNGKFVKRVTKYEDSNLDNYLTTNKNAAVNSTDSRDMKEIVKKVAAATKTPPIAFTLDPYKKRIRE